MEYAVIKKQHTLLFFLTHSFSLTFKRSELDSLSACSRNLCWLDHQVWLNYLRLRCIEIEAEVHRELIQSHRQPVDNIQKALSFLMFSCQSLWNVILNHFKAPGLFLSIQKTTTNTQTKKQNKQKEQLFTIRYLYTLNPISKLWYKNITSFKTDHPKNCITLFLVDILWVIV